MLRDQKAALALSQKQQALPADYGESFNIGTGRKTTIGTVAETAREQFAISHPPSFSMPGRAWDLPDWFANIEKSRDRLGWQPRTGFAEGLERTIAWYRDRGTRGLVRPGTGQPRLPAPGADTDLVSPGSTPPR